MAAYRLRFGRRILTKACRGYADMPIMFAIRRRWLRAVCSAAIVLFVACATFLLGERQSLRRYFSFAAYGNAITHWSLVHEGGRLPNDLALLEEAWNGSDGCMQSLPAPPTYEHPIYRPPMDAQGGPFLLVIEPEPKGISYPIRHLVYARSDGSGLRMARAWSWELDALIAHDDAMRLASSRRSPHATTQSSTGLPRH